jgi:acyl-CoA thioester hydrolase
MMPAVHTAQFTIRHYECDTYMHLNNANYVRYMEEAAFEASAAVGYDRTRYSELGTLWLVHDTSIEYLRPVAYGDTVEVKTWVADARRVRSYRMYEFRKAGADDVIARASTDWIYLDSATQRPMNIPAAMMQAFVPEGLATEAPPRERLPEFPAPPPAVYSLQRRVEWRDIDSAGHVNNAVYFNYIEDAGMQAARHFGWPMQRSIAAGFGIMARQQRVEYKQPARLDDELLITTWVIPDGRSTAFRVYTITRPADGALIARARSRWVWVDLQSGRPMRIPEDFMADFAEHIGSPA